MPVFLRYFLSIVLLRIACTAAVSFRVSFASEKMPDPQVQLEDLKTDWESCKGHDDQKHSLITVKQLVLSEIICLLPL